MARNGKNVQRDSNGKRRNGERRGAEQQTAAATRPAPAAEPDRRMVELRSWYRDRLPTRIAALEDARKQLVEKPVEGLDSIRRIAHSLRGSGSTYGFPEITESARKLEEAQDEDVSTRSVELLSALRAVAHGGKSERTSILLIEDDEELAHFMRTVLQAPDRDLYTAHTAAQARAILDARDVSLILLDLILPDTDGRNFLLSLRDRMATSAIPVVVVTVKEASQTKAECLALGADDFIEKPISREVMQKAVAARLRRGAESARELRRDPLTGLSNRAAFHEAFQRAQYLAGTTGESMCVALLDLDRFKAVNDSHGQAVGDQVLRRAATAVSRRLRRSDLLARWNGAQFVALLSNTNRAGAGVALGKALQALRDEPFQMGEGVTVRITFSAGIAEVDRSMSVESAVAEADRCLYLAKAAGRNRIHTSTDEIDPPRKRILIADDDELIRVVVARLLEQEGYEVEAYPDGTQALAGALEKTCSMVVSDVAMPGMDGFELLGRLRNLPPYAGVPIVMLTSMGREQDVVRGFELGADDYILKPFSSAELVARIRRLLK